MTGDERVGQELHCRYYISYAGIKLPLKLVNELENESLENRITYFKGYYDDKNRLKIIEKIVYGEIEFSHHYEYRSDGNLEKAILIEADTLPRTLLFDELGQAIEA